MFLSSTSKVVEFIVVVVPSTVSPPEIRTTPDPLGVNVIPTLVSSPNAVIEGAFPVAELVTDK